MRTPDFHKNTLEWKRQNAIAFTILQSNWSSYMEYNTVKDQRVLVLSLGCMHTAWILYIICEMCKTSKKNKSNMSYEKE